MGRIIYLHGENQCLIFPELPAFAVPAGARRFASRIEVPAGEKETATLFLHTTERNTEDASTDNCPFRHFTVRTAAVRAYRYRL
jgi:hypothetical protein